MRPKKRILTNPKTCSKEEAQIQKAIDVRAEATRRAALITGWTEIALRSQIGGEAAHDSTHRPYTVIVELMERIISIGAPLTDEEWAFFMSDPYTKARIEAILACRSAASIN
jgi:hypothetical protein